MPITINGPDWPTVRELRTALREVPENGSFTFGGQKYEATEQLERFRANGVRTIEFTHSRAEAEAWIRQGKTVFGRHENHSQGRDILVRDYRSGLSNRWLRRDWWCPYVTSVGEWRMHIFGGSSIARGKKIYRPEHATVDFNNPHALEPPAVAIRSRSRGWIMEHTHTPPEAIRTAAKAAVAALGYTYGAVDILELADGSAVVLEVNLLPAMDDYTRGKYVEAIRAHVARHGTRVQPVPAPTPAVRPDTRYFS